jgi:HEAT repeat protein/DNA polymerase III delta prime subunit
MGHIFISYARSDEQNAEQLEADLRTNGFVTWRDVRNLNPYQDQTSELEVAMRDASHVVVCLTPDVQRPDSFVRKEITYALNCKKPVIPLLFPGGELTILIVNYTYIDMEEYVEGLQKLLERLRAPVGPFEVPTYPAPSELVQYLNSLHENTSKLLEEGVQTLITLAATDSPQAAKSLSLNFSISPVLMNDMPAVLPTLAIEHTFNSFNEAFEYHDGRVLLLGEPGSGKTTTLLAFARDAAVERLNNPKAPVPVLVNINKWDQKMPIADWIRSEVNNAALDGYDLLYLLDGLDELVGEVGEDRDGLDDGISNPQTDFIREVNRQLAYQPLVITSRIADYERVGEKLNLTGAVTLQPLNNRQIRDYLEQRGQSELWDALSSDPEYMEMARTPLLLALLSIAFQPDEEKEQIDLTNLSEDIIFDCFIHRRFKHEKVRLGKKRKLPFDELTTREMLSALAIHMWPKYLSPKIELTLDEVKSILGREAEHFVIFAQKMHFLRRTSDFSVQFRHLKLRDFCVVPTLLHDLNEGNLVERWHAAIALGQIGNPTALPSLISALDDREWGVRFRAAEALGLIGDPVAISALANTLKDNNTIVRKMAVEALGRIGDPEAIPSLIEASRKDENWHVRSAASSVLGFLGDPRAIPPLLEALGDEIWHVRSVAVEALEQIGDSATSSLLSALDDEDWRVRANAAMVLGWLRDSVAVPGLLHILSDPNPEVRWRVADALGKIGDPEAIPLLLRTLYDEAEIVRINAFEALVRIGQRKISSLLGFLLDEDSTIRATTAFVLGYIAESTAIPMLLEVINDEDGHVRSAAIEALGRIGDPIAVSHLVEHLQDETRPYPSIMLRVCDVAAEALEKIGTPEALTALEEWEDRQLTIQPRLPYL